MRANLLRAVSSIYSAHAPLTSICRGLLHRDRKSRFAGQNRPLKQAGEAHEDAQGLNGMVENLLSVTRFDGGTGGCQKSPPTVLEEPWTRCWSNSKSAA